MDRPVFIVLIGPPGAGKTAIGLALSQELGWDFEDAEKFMLERYGSREAALANEEAVLTDLEAAYRSRAETSDGPIVLESTGLSERDILLRLARDYEVVFVKIWASVDTCAERVRSRPAGGNLNNDLTFTRDFHSLWEAEVEPLYTYDVEVSNDDLTPFDAVRLLSKFMTHRGPGEADAV